MLVVWGTPRPARWTAGEDGNHLDRTWRARSQPWQHQNRSEDGDRGGGDARLSCAGDVATTPCSGPLYPSPKEAATEAGKGKHGGGPTAASRPWSQSAPTCLGNERRRRRSWICLMGRSSARVVGGGVADGRAPGRRRGEGSRRQIPQSTWTGGAAPAGLPVALNLRLRLLLAALLGRVDLDVATAAEASRGGGGETGSRGRPGAWQRRRPSERQRRRRRRPEP